ncbi:transient receptor potential-gamma protein-like [Mercenaria mercenaria]|uniref:transient receptor potential-gamma protein-like n=1 Tax=Mercenaria mercenaria TaxID=6596 RepID=UPI00234EACD0|nr:transient receptor potential-gamma protein-like [Mercenaria mercenaria]
MFPLLCITYLIAPKSSFGKLIRKPFIKFICHSASYIVFLVLLILVSQRIEIPNIDNRSSSFVKETKTELRGAPATTIEWMILAYVAGLIWTEIKQLWDEGADEYCHDMWNILDFVTNSLYIATLTLRVIAYLQVQKERETGQMEHANLQRREWDPYDPNLIAEALFAAANIFSSLKLIYIFTVNPHLGPLQISLGRMIMDIMKFGVLYMLVLLSFACGLNHLHWYYATLRSEECHLQSDTQATRYTAATNLPYSEIDPCDRKYKSFANLFEIIQSLYWAIYGLVDLDHLELEEPHEFTEFIGKLMFGSYSWIGFVILLNLLIAMMSNSYQSISSQSDEEWKFARSRLWISYFDESGTLPAPFNIIPSPKTFYYILLWFREKLFLCSKDRKRNRWQSIRKVVKKINEREIRYQAVMRDLVKRYVMAKQRSPQRGEGVTEDDVNELKQDISSFRYELLEILRNNGMKTPNLNSGKPSNRRLSRRKNHRRSLESLKKSFTMSSLVDVTNSLGSEQKNNISSLGPDVLSSFRPTPVSMGCSKDIPETIEEESESRRESMVDANIRRSSAGKKIETLADIAQSSEESSNSATLLSPWVEENKTGAQNSSFCYSDIDLDGLEMNSLPVNVCGSVKDDTQGFQKETCELETDISCQVVTEDVSAVQYNMVTGNSKVKPAQSESLEKAIGFLLESKSKKNKTHAPVKRVKFNYV